MQFLVEWAVEIRLFATVVGLIGGFIAIFKFVEKIRDDKAASEAQRKRTWMEAAIHSEFNSSADMSLSFDEIKKRLSSSAFFKSSDLNLKEDELTDQNIRLLVVSMVEKGVVSQLYNDEYQLTVNQSEKAYANAMVEQQIFLNVIKVLGGAPSKFNSRGLHDEVVRAINSNVDFSYFEQILYSMQNRGDIIEINNFWELDR